jgi:hypothetical protein
VDVFQHFRTSDGLRGPVYFTSMEDPGAKGQLLKPFNFANLVITEGIPM